MTRRRIVVLASALTLFALGGLVVGAVVTVTQTGWGREKIRAYAQDFLNTKTKGKWHIGRLEGSLFTELVVDSFAISEKNDSAFVATGRVRVKFSPRDLFDRRIVVTELEVENAFVNISQDSTNTWNFRKIFPPGPKGPPKPKTVVNFGDYIVVNSARLKHVDFDLSMPWHPDDSLRGAKRDSAVAYALGRKDKEIRRHGSQFFQTVRHWTKASIVLGPSRVDDHNDLGRQFHVLRLDATESDPPFEFRNVQGDVRNKGDSLWAQIPHFELPGSAGRGGGKVWWGSGLPTRYDLTFEADTVSLADVAWVYPTLPTKGGGKMKLRIVNERDPHVLDYVLSDMDVRTMQTRLRGTMTFATGAPVFVIKDVDVRADPIDWGFIETFIGEPLPYPWRGTIDATLKASGGPINRWKIEDGQFFFRDANVAGATARGAVRGELDMLHPAFTVFRGFDVALDHLDLRTLQFLNPAFPHVFGTVAGKATLDSLWLDVRFRNADVTHRFEDGGPSRFLGNGRVTIGDKFLVYDMAMDANVLDLTTIARAYPEAKLEYRGRYAGPIRMQGAVDDLAIGAELVGAPGTLRWDGRVDADSAGGYGYHGTLNFSALDLRQLYDTVTMPRTSLEGTAEVDVVGDSLRNYRGSVDLQLERSLVDSIRVYSGSRARLRFIDDRMRFDTIHVESAVGTMSGRGAIGQIASVDDSIVFAVSADSIGAFRQYLIAAAGSDSVARTKAMTDSLQAELFGKATLHGSMDTLSLHAALDGRALRYGDYRARVARLALALEDVTHESLRGTASLTADTLMLSTVGVSSLGLDATVAGMARTDYKLLTTLANGPVLESRGTIGLRGDTTTVDMAQLRLALGDHEWALERPAGITIHPGAIAIDTVALAGSRGGRIAIGGRAPVAGEVAMRARADSVSLGDLAKLGQSSLALDGALSATLDVAGSRAEPRMQLGGAITGAKVGQVSVARANLSGGYAARRATGRIDVLRNDSVVVDLFASYPIDLALEPRNTRVVADTMRVAVRSDGVDMRVVEGFTPSIVNSTGRLSADFALSGPTTRTTLNGFLRVDSVSATLPAAGIRIRDFNADLRAERDTLRIRRFAMQSGDEPRDSLWLGGLAVLGSEDPSFDVQLGARDFRLIGKRSVADLSISSDLRLRGALSRSELSGSVTVNRGFIVIPEFSEKEVISLEDFASYNVVDTTLFSNRSLLPKAPPAFVKNLTIRNVQIAMGPEVWLRSAEANINVGGAVNVIVGRQLGSSTQPQVALDGTLQTVRGTYRLALGPVQRTFAIERGDLRFYGDPDLNPVLDINAIHTVRQISAGVGARNDVRIRVKVLGTLVRPRIVLESADSLQLSDSDLISYLVVGSPSFAIGGLDTRTYTDLFIGAAGSYFASRFSGRLFDYVQIQTASRGGSSGLQSQQRTSLLAGTQLGIGKQIGERTFVSLTAGLCTFQQAIQGQGQLSPADIAQSIGASLEQRLARGYGFSFSLEPTSTAIFCGAQTNRGFTPNRPQVGFDLFRSWRW